MWPGGQGIVSPVAGVKMSSKTVVDHVENVSGKKFVVERAPQNRGEMHMLRDAAVEPDLLDRVDDVGW